MSAHTNFDQEALYCVVQASLLMTEALRLLDKAHAHQAAALLDNAIGVLPLVDNLVGPLGEGEVANG